MRTNGPTLTLLLAAFALIPTLAAAQEDPPELPEPFLFDGLMDNKPLTPAEIKVRAETERERILEYGRKIVERRVILLADTDPEVEKIRKRFMGNWKLLTFQSRREGGELSLRPMTGRIMYDSDGNMAAQLMPEAEPDDSGRRRYIAYFGKFDIDTVKSEVTHHVKGSIFDRWVDTDLIRRYAFETSDSAPDRLTLSVWDGDTETTRLVWERLSK